jgi:hypothetical protein
MFDSVFYFAPAELCCVPDFQTINISLLRSISKPKLHFIVGFGFPHTPNQKRRMFSAKQNSPARKLPYCTPTRIQTTLMSRSPDSSTRRTKIEMHRSKTAATRIEAQNNIQPANIKAGGDGVPVSFGHRLMHTAVWSVISHLLQSCSSLSESTVRCDVSMGFSRRKF